jgi:hypothetical protein
MENWSSGRVATTESFFPLSGLTATFEKSAGEATVDPPVMCVVRGPPLVETLARPSVDLGLPESDFKGRFPLLDLLGHQTEALRAGVGAKNPAICRPYWLRTLLPTCTTAADAHTVRRMQGPAMNRGS